MKKDTIGIIGKLGSGKSYAGDFLSSLGGKFVDCDAIVAQLYKKGELGAKKIETFFGEEFIKNGAVNRPKLGRFVAKDEKKLRILEKIIHPLVLTEVQKKIDKATAEPIFIEIGAPSEKFLKLCKKVILIDAPHTQRSKRIKSTYLARIDEFKTLKNIKPDFTVKNYGSKKSFETNLKKTYNQLTIRH